MKKTLIFTFPGTNCETETFDWFADNLETKVEYFYANKHDELTPNDIDALVIPGGFSFGDYLRAGAIAARSREMNFIKRIAYDNVAVLGICNGFQILCESGLLEGALAQNITQQHHHFPVEIKIEESFFNTNEKNYCVWLPKILDEKIREKITKSYQKVFIPMSCGMGRYVSGVLSSRNLPSPRGLTTGLTAGSTVLFYLNNENGSENAVGGIANAPGNILGLMPHPERASSKFVGSTDGLIFLLGLSINKKIPIKKNSELENYFTNNFKHSSLNLNF